MLNQLDDLAAAVRDADEGATLVLEPGEYVTDRIIVRQSLTIAGLAGPDETRVRARDRGELLRVTGGTTDLTVRGLSLLQGTSDCGGAVAVFERATVHIDDCVLSENRARTVRGGAISVADEAFVRVSRTQFRENAGPVGGAMCLLGSSRGSIEKCYFERNGAEVGGAIAFLEAATATLVACTFIGNAASQDRGGAALFVSGTSTFGPLVELRNVLVTEERGIVNNLDRPGTIQITHSALRDVDEARASLEDPTLVGPLEMEEVGLGLWGVRSDSAAASLGDGQVYGPHEVDLLGTPFLLAGQAAPGAIAPRTHARGTERRHG